MQVKELLDHPAMLLQKLFEPFRRATRLNNDMTHSLNPSTNASKPPDLNRIEEQLWVLRAQQGDAQAFQCLVARYERQLLYYLTQFTNDPWQSADVLQDVWVAVFRGLKRLRAPQAFRVWLYQVARNRAATVSRRQVLEAEAKDALLEEQSVNPSFDEPVFVDAELVHRALGQLPPAHREVLVLRFLRDLSLEEIAEALSVSVGTVKSRLHYAKQTIKRRLEDQIRECKK